MADDIVSAKELTEEVDLIDKQPKVLSEEVVDKQNQGLAEEVVDKQPKRLAEEEVDKQLKGLAEEEVDKQLKVLAEEVVDKQPKGLVDEVVDKYMEELAEAEDKLPPEKVVSKHTKNKVHAMMDAEEFSIAEVTSSATIGVAKQREFLFGSFRLNVLFEDLGRVGHFVRTAYTGVAGYAELEIKIREIAHDVTKLCENSVATMFQFKQASSILDDLKTTYQCLFDGKEDIALVSLASLSEVAKGVVSSAEELHKGFDKVSCKVEGALKSTMMGEGKEIERKEEIEERNEKYKVEKFRAQRYRRASVMVHAKSKRRYVEDKEEKAHTSVVGSFIDVRDPFMYSLGIDMCKEEADEEMAKEHSEEALTLLGYIQKKRERQQKAIQDISEFAKQIEDGTVAIDALHQAIGGLQKLSVVMLHIATFWEQLQMHCEILAKENMQKIVQTAMACPEEERFRVWTHTAFKTHAIALYKQWVALEDVCTIYMMQIKETQKDLDGYLTQNPTVKEAGGL